MIILPIENGPEKPEFGSPCNGCGLCCANDRCNLAVDAIGAGPGPCPLMALKDGRFWCSLVIIEENLPIEPLMAQSLGIGLGCDAGLIEDFE